MLRFRKASINRQCLEFIQKLSTTNNKVNESAYYRRLSPSKSNFNSKSDNKPFAILNNGEQLSSTHDKESSKKAETDENNDSRPISPTIIITGILLLIGSVMEKSKKNVMSSDSIDDISNNNNHAWPVSSSNSTAALSRNFVADAVACVSPAVVNILSGSDGFLGTTGAFSAGSGFIISSEGIIVTNAHVVANAKNGKVIVTFSNGRIKKGTVQSFDSASDIALLKLDLVPEDLPIVKLGSSSKIRAGEFVVAIGSPMNLQNTASLGIVSATARHASELGLSNNRSEYLQTDAAINSGNSGGPLVNLDGEVIGINTMKVRGTDGISFAIPIDTAIPIIQQLKSFGKVRRPFAGFKMANWTPDEEMKDSLWKRNVGGRRVATSAVDSTAAPRVMVVEVVKNSPAHRAGLMGGDIIYEVNGKEVTGVKDVLDAIGLEAEKTLNFKISRPNSGFVYISLTTEPI